MKKIFVLSGLLAVCVTVRADNAVFQAALTPNIAIYSRDTEIHGLLLNFIWGENPQAGCAIGLINGSTGTSSGASIGLINYADTYHGIQWGAVNLTHDEFIGWQDGAVNLSYGTFQGFQSGIVNISEKTHGLQLGVANFAQNLDGVQLGLINVASNNGWFDQMPNKFAAVFPFFNYSF